MLEDEFREWLDRHLEAFPQLRVWLEGLPKPAATLGAWRGALADVAPEDAAAVTDAMVRGDIQAPAAYDRERTAAIVRQNAREIAWRRSACDQSDQPAKVAQRPRAGRSGRIAELMATDFAERTQGVAELLPEQVYGCDLCRDVGTVTVWHPVSVAEASETGEAPKRRATAAVACSCRRGDRMADGVTPGTGRPGYRRLPRYDENHYCRIEYGLPSADDTGNLLAWLANRQPVERVAAFDEWNAQPVELDDAF